ncbi:DEAD/DEAH box helicase [Dissulfurirhabdus thermomarina]|uniref:DEAD/DEAH box helicase n=1 Tax=Dissulfurirhabdus thermomarina TaxID=1765737 RepID=A0A6N9TK29_DISTH|nr:DEAD/DEAH box helicase [Dissulfurirhabdus thermomarina]NDY41605.1 DEAD/DEAH box helicase [Dissulfurirhabdus thermomarina]NMX23454.1 DEAD/DEAH box helicase [Dissulfurirhabdus thermomarina]
MARANLQKPKTGGLSWCDAVRPLFLPVIRGRGERYAREGRVHLERVSPAEIRGVVQGERDYAVWAKRDPLAPLAVDLGCTCPFFRQGFFCKHLWAALLEADRAGRRPAAAVAPPEDWRQVLDPGLWAPSGPGTEPEGAPGTFRLEYHLQVEPVPTLTVQERYVRKDGRPGRPRRLRTATLDRGDLPRADRTLLAVLSDVARVQGVYGGGWRLGPGHLERVAPSPRDLEVLLPLLAETGRCRVSRGEEVLADPLRPGGPGRVRLELRLAPPPGDPEGDPLLAPVLCFPSGETAGPEQVAEVFRTRPVFFVAGGRLHVLADVDPRVARRLLARPGVPVPREELADLLAWAERVSGLPPVRVEGRLAPPLVRGIGPEPRLVVRLREDRVEAGLTFSYEGLVADPGDPAGEILDAGRWRRIARDLSAEAAAAGRLREAGFRPLAHGGFECGLAAAARALGELASEGWHVEAEGGRPLRAGRIRRLQVASGVDWFDLRGTLDFGGVQVPLPRAVRAYLQGRRLVRLDDGSVGLLPEEWFARHAPAMELAEATGGAKGGFRFRSSHALLLDAMLAEAAEVETDARFDEMRRALEGFTGIRPLPAPREFRGRLRPYQREALGWFGFLKDFGLGGILADDMGLGKTVQVLAWLLRERGRGPSLVVAPTSLVHNWVEEARRFAPALETGVHAGPRRDRRLSGLLPDLLVTTYGVLRRDIARLREIPFHYVVLDESQAVKNPASQAAKAVRLLRARHRLCLTGTPIENHAGELWSQMEFLNPGLLGPLARFERNFVRPLAAGDPAAAAALRDLVRPFVLRRTKEEVAAELPEKVEHVVTCPMTPGQARVYARLRDHYRGEVLAAVDRRGVARARMKVLEGLLRLRQAAVHPGLVGAEAAGSGKLEKLMELVRGAVEGGHRALVFSQFTSFLALLRQALADAGIPFESMEGRTPRAARARRIARFQAGEVPVFLVSLRAGGVGLNLTAADYVFLVDPWWNPAVEAQAVDRAHRIGQERRVFTYRLVSAETVEEKVRALQERKQEAVRAVLAGGRNPVRELTREDLERLFS